MAKENYIGAIWLRKTKKEETYLSGQLELEGKDGPKIKIVAFKNNYKERDNQPDFYIQKAMPVESPKKNDSDVPF